MERSESRASFQLSELMSETEPPEKDISLVLSDSGVDTVVDFRAVYSFSGKILP